MAKIMPVIYLNNAATSFPKAPGVADAVKQALCQVPGDANRTIATGEDTGRQLRHRLAALFDAKDPQRVILTQHATHALNIILWGLIKPGMTVATSWAEHNSVIRPLHHIQQQRGIHLIWIRPDAQGHYREDDVEHMFQHAPNLLVLNHVSNVTGQLHPVESLFRRARTKGICTVLDASQSAGHLPVHMNDLAADVMAFTGHKALLGPPGTGGFVVAPGIEIKPFFAGGTGIHSETMTQPMDMPLRLEPGTPNLPAWSGLNTALQWLQANEQNVYQHLKTIGYQLYSGLQHMSGVHLLSQGHDASAMASFTLNGWSVKEAAYILEHSYGIRCRAGLHCAPLIHQIHGTQDQGVIRLSASCFTTKEEIDHVLEAIHTLVKPCRS